MKRLTLQSFRRSRTQSPNRGHQLSGTGTGTSIEITSTTDNKSRRSSGIEYFADRDDLIGYYEGRQTLNASNEKGTSCRRSDKKTFFRKLRRRLLHSVKKNNDMECGAGYASDPNAFDKNRCRNVRNTQHLSKSLSSCQSLESALERLMKDDILNASPHSTIHGGVGGVTSKQRESETSTKRDAISRDQLSSIHIDGDDCNADPNEDDHVEEKYVDTITSHELSALKADVDAHSGSRGSTSTMQSDSYRVSGVGPVYNQVNDQPKICNLWQELSRLSHCGWYWGPITRVEADEKLANEPDGAFLVRDSSDSRYLLSLSFRSHGRVLHTRIEHCNGLFSFYAQPDTEGYPSIVELIERSIGDDSQTGAFCYSRSRSPGAPSFHVRLKKPVSRLTRVRSLQYWCRFAIRQHVRIDYIQLLPLPTRIKSWIEETQY